MQRVTAWIIIIVAFAVLNGVLYGSQYMYGTYRVRALERFKDGMDSRWADFLKTKTDIETIRRQLRQDEERLGRLKSEIADIESEYQEGGAPSDVYTHYQSLIQQHNAIVAGSRPLIDRHDMAVKLFNSQVSAYNRDVDQYNSLLAKVPQSIWVIIPMPSRAAKSARTPSKPVGPLAPVPTRP